MTRGKWTVLVLVALSLGASAAVLLLYRHAERLDDWLGRQVIGIANNHLSPDLDFGSLEFHAPGIITLHDATLTARAEAGAEGGDADGDGNGVRVLDIGRLEIALGEMPRIGRPLKIVALTIEDGAIRIHRDPETGEIAGLLPIVDEDLGKKDDEGGVPGEFRLSNVMRLEQIDLVNLSIEYREGDAPPMRLTGITTKLLINEASPALEAEPAEPDTSPAAASAAAPAPEVLPIAAQIEPDAPPAPPTDLVAPPTEPAAPATVPADAPEPGWYALDLDLGRAPGLRLTGDGRFNLDTFTLDLADLNLAITVDPSTIESLPPQLQTILREHNASGALSLNLSGFLPLKDPLTGTLTGRLRLRDFDLAAGKYQLPIQSLDAPLAVGNGIAKVGPMVARIHDGQIDAFATANLAAETRGADLEWTITGLDLNKFLRSDLSAEDAGAVAMGGIVSGSGAAATALTDPKEQLTGRGTLEVTEGNLLFLPGLKQIADVMKVVLRAEGTHQLHAKFDLSPEGVTITQSEVVTEVLAARASGKITFEGSLDIAINAGPMERLQAALGKIGDIFGSITDQLMRYRLHGTVKEPKVSVEAF